MKVVDEAIQIPLELQEEKAVYKIELIARLAYNTCQSDKIQRSVFIVKGNNGLTACPALCGGLRLTINNLRNAFFSFEQQEGVDSKTVGRRPPHKAGQAVRPGSQLSF